MSFILKFRQWCNFQKGKFFFQYLAITSNPYIFSRHIRQPQKIIRKMSADPISLWFMPPMLDISLCELMSCMQEDLCTSNFRPQMRYGQAVLKLVPKTESTT